MARIGDVSYSRRDLPGRAHRDAPRPGRDPVQLGIRKAEKRFHVSPRASRETRHAKNWVGPSQVDGAWIRYHR